jgi:hypothetical protein
MQTNSLKLIVDMQGRQNASLTKANATLMGDKTKLEKKLSRRTSLLLAVGCFAIIEGIILYTIVSAP